MKMHVEQLYKLQKNEIKAMEYKRLCLVVVIYWENNVLEFHAKNPSYLEINAFFFKCHPPINTAL